jgi:hypothetical protein
MCKKKFFFFHVKREKNWQMNALGILNWLIIIFILLSFVPEAFWVHLKDYLICNNKTALLFMHDTWLSFHLTLKTVQTCSCRKIIFFNKLKLNKAGIYLIKKQLTMRNNNLCPRATVHAVKCDVTWGRYAV